MAEYFKFFAINKMQPHKLTSHIKVHLLSRCATSIPTCYRPSETGLEDVRQDYRSDGATP